MLKKYKVLYAPDSSPGIDAPPDTGGVSVESPSGGNASNAATIGQETSKDVAKRWNVGYSVDQKLPDNSSLKGTEISFDDDKDEVDIKPTTKPGIQNEEETVKPTEEKKKEEEKTEKKLELTIPQQQQKPEDKKAETEKKDEVKPQTEVKPGEKVQRDVSAYPSDIQPLLKKMANESFTLFEKTYKEANDLKVKTEEQAAQIKQIEDHGLPLSYFNHPRAITLHPFYQETTQRLGQIQRELGFWNDQLNKIEEGEQWQQLVEYDEQGQPVFSAPMEANPEAKKFVRNIIARGTSQGNDLEGKVASMVNGYQAHMAKVNEYIAGAHEKYFPWAKDEKHPLQKFVKEYMSYVPIEVRHERSAITSAYLYATVQQLTQELAEFRKQKGIATTIKKQEQEIEPAVSSVAQVSANNSGKTVLDKILPGGTLNNRRVNYVPPAEFSMED